MNIHGLLFDLDDTLYDRTVAFRGWAIRFVQAHLSPNEPARLAEIVTALETIDAGGYGDRFAFVSEIKRHFPAITDLDATVLETFRIGFMEELTLAPETEALLDLLAEKQVPFGIITNGSTLPQKRKILRLGLDRRTDCLFISEEFGAKKPDARIFHAAATCLGVAPEAILFVGDHPQNDIVGAKRAGMKTAWLSREAQWPLELDDTAIDIRLNTLSHLKPFLP